MYHEIICESSISKDDAATKSWYHLSLSITSPYDTYTWSPRLREGGRAGLTQALLALECQAPRDHRPLERGPRQIFSFFHVQIGPPTELCFLIRPWRVAL
jgi:hypothetical protein